MTNPYFTTKITTFMELFELVNNNFNVRDHRIIRLFRDLDEYLDVSKRSGFDEETLSSFFMDFIDCIESDYFETKRRNEELEEKFSNTNWLF